MFHNLSLCFLVAVPFGIATFFVYWQSKKNKTMNTVQEQAAIDAAQADVDADNEKLAADTLVLNQAKDALANVNLINTLEAMTPDQVATLKSELANDTDNTNGITVSLPA